MPSQEEFEDKFRKKFEDWEAPAPAWESFQVHIPPAKQKSKNKYRLLLWWGVGMVAVFVGTWLMTQGQYTTEIKDKTYPSTAENKPIQKKKSAESTNSPTHVGKDSSNTFTNLPTQQAGKDSTDRLTNSPTQQAGKDSTDRLTNSPTHVSKDSTDRLTNSPTQAGKDSSNKLTNSPTQAGKDSSNKLTNSPTQAGKDSTQQSMADRLIFAMNGLPILPIKNAFDAPTPNYRIDTTWKWDAKQHVVGKWAIAGYFAPVYTYKIVTPNTKDSIFIENFVANTRMAVQNRGYQIGGRIERRLGKRIGVYGGLQYQYSHLQTDYVYYTMEQANYRVDSSYQYKLYLTPIIPRNQVGNALVYHNLMAEVGVHYRVRLGRWESVLGAGVGYQYALHLRFESGSERYRVPYSAHHFTTQASWQIGYVLTPQKIIFAEPTIQNNHTRLFKGGLYDLRTYQVGWRVGLKWRL